MTLRTYSNPSEVAKALIQSVFIEDLARGQMNLAISGGSTPKLLFELMAQEPYRSAINWSNLHIYWVDERCVPPTDKESNYLMTAEALLKHVPIPNEQIHRIQGEAEDIQAEAKRYTSLVEAQLPLSEAEQLPCFDIILLGLGDDGHTSSIFPSEMHLLEEKTPYVVATNPYSGQKRIALTGQTILQAKRLIVHSVGSGKQAVLQDVVAQNQRSMSYPSAYFFRHRADLELYTDQLLDSNL